MLFLLSTPSSLIPVRRSSGVTDPCIESLINSGSIAVGLGSSGPSAEELELEAQPLHFLDKEDDCFTIETR